MGSCYLQEYVVVENIFLVVLFSRKSNRVYRPASVIEIFLTRDDLREGFLTLRLIAARIQFEFNILETKKRNKRMESAISEQITAL